MPVTAIYPGTFDPVTKGHMDLCHRALKMFDKVVVGVADNPGKHPFFNVDERVQMLEEVLKDDERITVLPFTGLLIDFAREVDAIIIVRGLRAISDFEFEVQLAGMNRTLAKEIETVFLTAAEKYAFTSSSLVREIAGLKGDVSDFLHPYVLDKLHTKIEDTRG